MSLLNNQYNAVIVTAYEKQHSVIIQILQAALSEVMSVV